MRQRNLGRGFSMQLHEPATNGLQVVRASPLQRERLGFSDLLIESPTWPELERSFAGYKVLPPKFAPRSGRRPRRRTLLNASSEPGRWAGVVSPCPAADRLVRVGCQWATPRVGVPAHAPLGMNFAASFWTGLDGDLGTSDVVQAGCDGQVVATPGGPQISYRPWYEWYPGITEWITNLAVSQGDVLRCILTVNAANMASATVMLANVTTNQLIQPFTIQAPPGQRLAGNCAEWIVEGFGSLGPMAVFDPVRFNGCSATSANGRLVTGGAGRTLNIVDGGLTLAAAQITSPTDVRVIYV